MKIAFLTPEYPTETAAEGGLANYVKKTAAALAERGCQVWVFVCSGRDLRWCDGPVTICEVRPRRLPGFLNRLPLAAHLVPALQRRLAARALARALRPVQREVGLDIVQSSSYQTPGYALLGNGAVPVVCRVSSYTPLCLAAGGTPRTLADYLQDWMELRQVRDADASFAPSAFLARYLLRLEAHQTEVVRTPLEPLDQAEDDRFFAAHRPGLRYLLYFGTLNRLKGVDLLARALPGVLARHPDLGCVFIGRDDGMPDGTRLADLVLDQCRDYHPRLFFFPSLDKARLFPFVRHAEGVLMPSRVDNYPNACLEALQLGTPVIGSDDSSIEELVRDGVNGFLFRNGDPESLAGSIERLLALAPQEREALRQEIKTGVDAIASEDRIGELLAFYRRVLHRYQQRREQ